LTGPLVKGRLRWLRLTILCLIAVSFAVVLSQVLQLRSELKNLQEDPVDSLQWNVTQLELDVVRFETEARIAALDPASDLAPLRQRFDLFYSRVGTMLEGAMFTRLGLIDSVAPMKARMRAFLDATAPMIDSADPVLRAALPGIVTEAQTLRADLRVMTIQVIDANAALQDSRRLSLTELVQTIGLASLVLIGLLLALLGLVIMISRQADRRTREVQRITARLEATVATSLDAVIVAGMDGRIIAYNDAAQTIFGYSRTEALGQPLGALVIPPQHRAAHDAGMARIRAGGVKHVVDAGRIRITALRKSGEEFPVELSIASSDGPDGTIFIAYLRDISEAEQAAAAMIAARDKAQAAEQTKTNFIAVMSHEMRTPLNGVIGALEILGRSPLEPRQHEFLALAHTSAQQLLRHVKDVLDISRVEAGHARLQMDRFDLAALIASVIDPLRPQAAKKGLAIDVQLLGDFPGLRGDPFRIGQILQNFVSNAIKFTSEGGITVEAERQSVVADRAEIELRVIDTGIGIAEADQDRIFEDFVMIDPSHGRSVGGTGLGLAISRRLSRAMGGEVGVESLPGEGSCFWLRLPLDVDSSSPGPLDRGALTQPDTPDVPGLDILVVEDNETNRIVLDEMLRHLGHRVTLAVNGADGVEAARATRFDVILMDLSMPLMDGWTAARAIRLGGASQQSRILAVTAHARPENDDRMSEAGIDGWLTKPLTIKTVQDALSGLKPQVHDPKDGDGDIPLLDPERQEELDQLMSSHGLHDLRKRFAQEMELIMQTLSTAPEDTSLEVFAALLHSGAGAAGVVGATKLSQLLSRQEALCRLDDRQGLRAGIVAVRGVWHETREAWRAL
jgi:PAS domain S-box-containing protein